MTLKWKWIVGVAGTLTLGALGSGLWNVLFAPLGSVLVKAALSLVTLGISSARDQVYATAARGYAERASVMLLVLVGLVALIAPLGALISELILSRLARKLKGKTGPELERFQKRGLVSLRTVLPLNAILGAIILVQILIAGYANTVIANFHRSLTIARPYISSQEHDKFLARFAKVHTRQDFLSLFKDLNAVLLANGEQKSDFSPW